MIKDFIEAYNWERLEFLVNINKVRGWKIIPKSGKTILTKKGQLYRVGMYYKGEK